MQNLLSNGRSDDSSGAVLQQEVDGVIQPLGFFSSIFSRTERKYPAFDRELTAIVMALKHFRYFLEAREFTIYTDHKPIVNALHSEADREKARQSINQSINQSIVYFVAITTQFQLISSRKSKTND